MSISASLRKLLVKNDVAHRIYHHPKMDNIYDAALWHKIDPSRVLNVQILTVNKYNLLAIYPITHKVDFNILAKKINKNFQFMATEAAAKIFRDCEFGLKIPFGSPYKLDVVLDKSIEGYEKIFFSGGGYTSLIEMRLEDFLFLNSGAMRVAFTTLADSLDVNIKYYKHPLQIEGYDLPKIPQVISQILGLSQVSDKNMHELSQLAIAQTSLPEELLRHFNVLSMAEQSDIDGLAKFTNLSHIVIGFSAGKALEASDIELTYLKDFWLHSFMAASLAEDLSKQVTTMQLDSRISFLSGMLHNIGFILLCKLFPPEFKLLQKWQNANPDIPIQILEKKLLGMGRAFDIMKGGHAQIGEWLLKSWGLPESICVITRYHHDLNYNEKYSHYVKILQITNYLLKCHQIGDGDLIEISASMLESLGLTQETLDSCLERALNLMQDLEALTYAITK